MRNKIEKKEYHEFYNTVIVITVIIIVFLIISIPQTKDILSDEHSLEFTDINILETQTLETEKFNHATNWENKIKIEEGLYYVVVEKMLDKTEHENLVYPNLALRTGLDTTGYTLVYINDDGNVIKVETIKGLVFDIKETVKHTSAK